MLKPALRQGSVATSLALVLLLLLGAAAAPNNTARAATLPDCTTCTDAKGNQYCCP